MHIVPKSAILAPPSEPAYLDHRCTFEVLLLVISAYYAALLPAVLACLAVVASLALKGRTLPLSLMLEGYSGYGKTAVLQMFFDAILQKYVYRSDKFTPASFVSHATNVAKKDLPSKDLLPKLKNKVLMTKELAPLFRGREDKLVEIFANLCTVLDGKGLTTDTGAHGGRGYKEHIIFNWLGCTTPIPTKTHRIMFQLGTRLLFFEMPAVPIEHEDLLAYMREDTTKEAEEASRQAITALLTEFFTAYPIDSTPPESIIIWPADLEEMAHWAQLLAAGRADLKRDSVEDEDGNIGRAIAVAAHPPEAAYKISTYFKQLARGSALISGRDAVNREDLDLVAHVAISSVPSQYRPLLRAMREQKKITSTEAMAICERSKHTVLTYLRDLQLLGFGKLQIVMEKEKLRQEMPAVFTRADKYDWMEQS